MNVSSGSCQSLLSLSLYHSPSSSPSLYICRDLHLLTPLALLIYCLFSLSLSLSLSLLSLSQCVPPLSDMCVSLSLSLSLSFISLPFFSPRSLLFLSSFSPLSLLFLSSLSPFSLLFLSSFSPLSLLFLSSFSPLSPLSLSSISHFYCLCSFHSLHSVYSPPVSLNLLLCLDLFESLSTSHMFFFSFPQSFLRPLSFTISINFTKYISAPQSLSPSQSLSLFPSVSLFILSFSISLSHSHIFQFFLSLPLSLSLSLSFPSPSFLLFLPMLFYPHPLHPCVNCFSHCLFMFCIPPTMLKPLEVVWSYNPTKFSNRKQGVKFLKKCPWKTLSPPIFPFICGRLTPPKMGGMG